MATAQKSSTVTKPADKKHGSRPLVLITGAAGDIGSALISALSKRYKVLGLDLEGKEADCELLPVDLSSPDSVKLALMKCRERHGEKIASVIHLAAYFDFTGEAHPLYEKVNVEGTRNLLEALQDFSVEQLVYSGTMLVHRSAEPGRPIDEDTPIEPKWVYPQSKARAEDVIRDAHGEFPYVLLHLAGLYDDRTAVPTLAAQIRRIYERNPKGHVYAGSLETGQSFVHKEDMVDAFVRTVDRRGSLPGNTTILIGEAEAASYESLQSRIAELIHGEEDWKTVTAPKSIAEIGANLDEKSEPIVPRRFRPGGEALHPSLYGRDG